MSFQFLRLCKKMAISLHKIETFYFPSYLPSYSWYKSKYIIFFTGSFNHSNLKALTSFIHNLENINSTTVFNHNPPTQSVAKNFVKSQNAKGWLSVKEDRPHFRKGIWNNKHIISGFIYGHSAIRWILA